MFQYFMGDGDIAFFDRHSNQKLISVFGGKIILIY